MDREQVKIRLYLAGSIAASLDNQHWRSQWKAWLESLDLNIQVVDPLIERGALELGDQANRQNIGYIVRNDRMLLESCHVLLIVTDLVTPTAGTWVEMAWADDKNLHIILFVTSDEYTSKKPLSAFLRAMCDEIIVDDIAQLEQILRNFQRFAGEINLG